MSTSTIDMTDVLGLAALDFDLDPIPVVDVPQAQGDLLIIPWPVTESPQRRAKAVAAATVVVAPEAVVRGQGGNVHTLVDPDSCGVMWSPSQGQTVGTVVVPAGGRACLDHAEHGRLAIGPGVYVIRRQREQAEQIRMVTD